MAFQPHPRALCTSHSRWHRTGGTRCTQAFHAVPSYERFSPIIRAARRTRGQRSVEFVPIVYPSAAIGRRMSADPTRWHAWEFSLRALTTASSEQIATDTAALLAEPCTCFERVEANTAAFNPLARAAALRLDTFRAASLHNVHRLLQRTGHPLAQSTRRQPWMAGMRSLSRDSLLRAKPQPVMPLTATLAAHSGTAVTVSPRACIDCDGVKSCAQCLMGTKATPPPLPTRPLPWRRPPPRTEFCNHRYPN